MSTLEKTINLLNILPENQIETIYSFVQFISAQQTNILPVNDKPLNEILSNIVGAIPESDKTLDVYREERITERYETTDWYQCTFRFDI